MKDKEDSSNCQVEDCSENDAENPDELATIRIVVQKKHAALIVDLATIADTPVNLVIVELESCLRKIFRSVEIQLSQSPTPEPSSGNLPLSNRNMRFKDTEQLGTPEFAVARAPKNFDDLGANITKYLSSLDTTKKIPSQTEDEHSPPKLGSPRRSPFLDSFSARTRPEFCTWVTDIQNETLRTKASLVDEAMFRLWRLYGFPKQPPSL